ncbi:MAG: endo alpha-1,4 polygalactosaminidase [Chloroflexota bacterium]
MRDPASVFRLLAAGWMALLIAAPAAAGASGTWWRPGPGTTWDIVLSVVPTAARAPAVQVLDIDLFETPASTIAALKGRGIRVICYFSAGSAENWRSDYPQLLPYAGKPLDGWPGERWLDVRAPQVRAVMQARIDLAAAKGCDGVDPDNVDGWSNDTGFGLRRADSLRYLRFLAGEAHARGMAIGLKNAVELAPRLAGDFDFAVNEQCLVYDECGRLAPFISSGKAVFHIEYGKASKARAVCPKAGALGFSTVIKRMNLGTWGIACR